MLVEQHLVTSADVVGPTSAHFGSRPASRARGGGSRGGLRARRAHRRPRRPHCGARAADRAARRLIGEAARAARRAHAALTRAARSRARAPAAPTRLVAPSNCVLVHTIQRAHATLAVDAPKPSPARSAPAGLFAARAARVRARRRRAGASRAPHRPRQSRLARRPLEPTRRRRWPPPGRPLQSSRPSQARSSSAAARRFGRSKSSWTTCSIRRAIPRRQGALPLGEPRPHAHALRRDQTALLFKSGDRYEGRVLDESARGAARAGFLADVRIAYRTYDAASNSVDVEVRVRDAWSLSLNAKLSHSGGKTEWGLGLDDDNFLGYGKRSTSPTRAR